MRGEKQPISATEEGTFAFRRRFAGKVNPEHFRTFRGLHLSSIGLGTYLGNHDAETDRLYQEAVIRAVQLGVNVIDTAINYRCQRSERVIGGALSTLFKEGAVSREEIIVATKGGFIPFDGSPPLNPSIWFQETYVRPGIVKPEEVVAGCHSLAPRYIQDQLSRSLQNLGLDAIDIYYLHNPETQLGEVSREEFHRRMRAAFEALEEAVSLGKIRMYGTATWNGYRQDPSAQDYLSLKELWDLAKEVAGEAHHFRAVQLPYNLAMVEAFALKNQQVNGKVLSLLEAAHHLGIYVFASASLYQGHLSQRLPPFIGEHLTGLRTDAQRAIQFVRSTPGLGTSLVGMKSPDHVEENARVVGAPVAPPEAIRSLFRR
ncbi:MAG: aldo/keto reductase [Candidatus Methylomirabilales bacterium]